MRRAADETRRARFFLMITWSGWKGRHGQGDSVFHHRRKEKVEGKIEAGNQLKLRGFHATP